MSLSAPSIANIVEMMQIFHVTADYLLSTSERILVDITDLSDKEKTIILQLVDCFEQE